MRLGREKGEFYRDADFPAGISPLREAESRYQRGNSFLRSLGSVQKGVIKKVFHPPKAGNPYSSSFVILSLDSRKYT